MPPIGGAARSLYMLKLTLGKTFRRGVAGSTSHQIEKQLRVRLYPVCLSLLLLLYHTGTLYPMPYRFLAKSDVQ